MLDKLKYYATYTGLAIFLYLTHTAAYALRAVIMGKEMP